MQHEFKVGDMVESLKSGSRYEVLCVDGNALFVRGDYRCILMSHNVIPAKSEREKAVEVMMNASLLVSEECASELYDAGYRKVESE